MKPPSVAAGRRVNHIRTSTDPAMKSLEALIADGGVISIGSVDWSECVASANDGHNMLATLVRHEEETLTELLRRLDKAVKLAYTTGEITDEIND